MSVYIPPRGLFQRWNAIFCAVAIFIWSGPEEDRPIFAALLATWLALSITAWWVTGHFGDRIWRGWRLWAGFAAAGAFTGALANLCAILLMIFKDARHAHPFPDYPPALLGAMLTRFPAWAAAGTFAGLGVALWLSSRRLNDMHHLD